MQQTSSHECFGREDVDSESDAVQLTPRAVACKCLKNGEELMAALEAQLQKQPGNGALFVQ